MLTKPPKYLEKRIYPVLRGSIHIQGEDTGNEVALPCPIFIVCRGVGQVPSTTGTLGHPYDILQPMEHVESSYRKLQCVESLYRKSQCMESSYRKLQHVESSYRKLLHTENYNAWSHHSGNDNVRNHLTENYMCNTAIIILKITMCGVIQ